MMQTTLYLDESWRVYDNEERAVIGHAVHVKDVLNDLPRYMEAMKNLRSCDVDTYHFIAKMGAPVTPDTSLFCIGKVNPEFLKEKPTIRCVFFDGTNAKKGFNPCVGMYIQKVGNAWNVQPSNHLTYRLAMIWRDTSTARRAAYAQEAYVSISETGDVRLLKNQGMVNQELPRTQRKRPDTGNRYNATVHRFGWITPDWVRWVSHDNGMKLKDWLQDMVALLSWATPETDGILVRCHDGDVRCSFTVYKRNASRFFADRDIDAETGHKAKILHYVRGHYRAAIPEEQFVRPHYRGERNFTWNGYDVRLSVPDWHHANISRLSASSFIEPEDAEISEGMIGPEKLGHVIGKNLDRQFFLSKSSYRDH